MNKTKVKQYALIVTLFGIAGFLFYYSTWTEEQRLILSQATVKGRITYKGKPVPYALVIMANEKSASTGAADSNGNYTVQNAPPGKVNIGVNTAAGRGMLMSATMAALQTGDKSSKPSFLDVPVKFFDPATSGLTTEVQDRKEPHDFNIEIK